MCNLMNMLFTKEIGAAAVRPTRVPLLVTPTSHMLKAHSPCPSSALHPAQAPPPPPLLPPPLR